LRGVFFAGNFLSKTNGVRGIGEELAERFSERGWKVITASHYMNRAIRMVDFFWTAWHQRENYEIASVEVYSDLAFRWAELLCAFLRYIDKPYVLTLHGGKLPEFANKNPERFKELISRADSVTTPSKYLLQEFEHTLPSIVYIPNGIDLADYPLSVHRTPKPKIIWLRAFHSIYMPTLAIEVLQKVLKYYTDAHLTMIGPDKHDGTYCNTLKKMRDYSLQDNVLLIGAINKKDVSEYLSKGDIFLNTTIYESFGVSVVEAAACGLCIVTTNVGELPFMWADGVDALLVPPNDPDAMANAVMRILKEPGLAEKLSTNARIKAEKFDWAEVLPHWEVLFEEIIHHA